MKTYKEYTDDQIIVGIRSNDDNAVKAIYYDRLETIKKYLRNKLKNKQEEDDIIQTCVIAFYEKVKYENFELINNAKISTYLFSITKNQLKKKYRDSKKLIHKELISEIIETQESHDNLDNQRIQTMYELFEKLSEKCKSNIKGHHLENLSDKDLSPILGFTIENVRKNRHKCMKKLKDLLKNKYSYE